MRIKIENLALDKIRPERIKVEKVIRWLNINNCALIGHSLGGLIAQKTVENTDSIKALVTIASAPRLALLWR